MIKTILVPADGTDADLAMFEATLSVARWFGSHIDVLHVRANPAEVAARLASENLGFATISAELVDRWERDAQQREERALRQFQTFFERNGLTIVGATLPGSAGLSAEWHREIGQQPEWMIEYGRTSDLLVISRSIDGEGVAPETMKAALLESGRPLLIPGTRRMRTPFYTVAIAWKSMRESARAVNAAMPILTTADRIVIVTIAEDEQHQDNSAKRLATSLRRHGLGVFVRELQADRRNGADTLLTAAGEIEADLIVMGGYGHGLLREIIFGGFTERVLQRAEIAVLMTH